MSCNLQDPRILEAYNEIIDYEPTDCRSVAALMPVHNAQLTATMPSELSDTNIHAKLKVGENKVPGKTSSRPLSMSKRNSMRLQSASSNSAPPSPVPVESISQSPESGISEEPEIIEHEEALQAEQRYQEELQQREEEKAEQERINEIERLRLEREEDERQAAAEAQEQERLALEEESRKAAQAEADRHAQELKAQREKEALERNFAEAERKGDVLLSGFVSVQNKSPFWKRRFFAIKGSNMLLYRDIEDKRQAQALNLSKSSTVIRTLTGDYDINMPNAIQVRVQGDEFNMFADNNEQMRVLVTALSKAAGIAN
ncbi:hypothetical protein NQZ79_g3281 [Umbelopsis isabellina]|nr:hypothetical protein NQZ79_g3281 [Umbelopsis isabellina]